MPPSERIAYERALRSAVLASDELAWQTLYDDAFEALFAYVSWRCGGLRDLAEEIVQETWLIAVRRMRTFDPAKASFLSWLRGIAANLLRNRFRQERRGRMEPLDGSQSAAAMTDELERREQAEMIALALAALPEHYEAVLRAKYLEQQSVEQIALERGESLKSVESLLTRARQAFRVAYPHTPEQESFTRMARP
jgi:RNA polymerase sigma-70 factor (ECF subfamily)